MSSPAAIARAAERASARLAGHVRETPLLYSPHFSALTGASVWFKLENLQYTGSFKLRGAFNRLLTLDRETIAAGAVAASSGNHGVAVAWALRDLMLPGVIFVPERTSPAKVEAIRNAGGDVRYFGEDGLDTEMYARDYADRHGMVYVSPYNDPEIIAGQGTCGIEIARQLPAIDAVFVAVGGGGLVSGIGAVLGTLGRPVAVMGCQPANSPVMSASVRAGRILPLESRPTLSDGTAGGIEPDAITFAICREVVDDFLLVDEPAIGAAMREYMLAERQLVEGAAGVAIAGLLERGAEFAGRNVVAVVCGANITASSLAEILAG